MKAISWFVTIIIFLQSPLVAQNILVDNPPQQATLLTAFSTFINERDFAITRDGKEVYYTISTPKSSFQTIVVRHKIDNGNWTSPEVVSFAGQYSDLEPAFSADGKTLYFSSNRPLTGDQPKDFDIWKVSRIGEGWGEPVNLGIPINTSADEFYPSITLGGAIYFTAAYDGGVGKEDIYKSDFHNGQYQKALVLDTAINSKGYEFNAFVDPQEQYILFTAYGRKDDMGGGDLYISLKNQEGQWQPAVHLTFLNSRQLDYCPYVSADGTRLFFTSDRHQLPVSFKQKKVVYKDIVDAFTNPLNGTGNIYWIDFKKVLDSIN